MKKVILATLLLAGSMTFADNGTEVETHDQMDGKEVSHTDKAKKIKDVEEKKKETTEETTEESGM